MFGKRERTFGQLKIKEADYQAIESEFLGLQGSSESMLSGHLICLGDSGYTKHLTDPETIFQWLQTSLNLRQKIRLHFSDIKQALENEIRILEETEQRLDKQNYSIRKIKNLITVQDIHKICLKAELRESFGKHKSRRLPGVYTAISHFAFSIIEGSAHEPGVMNSTERSGNTKTNSNEKFSLTQYWFKNETNKSVLFDRFLGEHLREKVENSTSKMRKKTLRTHLKQRLQSRIQTALRLTDVYNGFQVRIDRVTVDYAALKKLENVARIVNYYIDASSPPAENPQQPVPPQKAKKQFFADLKGFYQSLQ